MIVSRRKQKQNVVISESLSGIAVFKSIEDLSFHVMINDRVIGRIELGAEGFFTFQPSILSGPSLNATVMRDVLLMMESLDRSYSETVFVNETNKTEKLINTLNDELEYFSENEMLKGSLSLTESEAISLLNNSIKSAKKLFK